MVTKNASLHIYVLRSIYNIVSICIPRPKVEPQQKPKKGTLIPKMFHCARLRRAEK